MKGLGELVPILGGIQVSSKISFQCMFLYQFNERIADSVSRQEYDPRGVTQFLQGEGVFSHVLQQGIIGRFILFIQVRMMAKMCRTVLVCASLSRLRRRNTTSRLDMARRARLTISMMLLIEGYERGWYLDG